MLFYCREHVDPQHATIADVLTLQDITRMLGALIEEKGMDHCAIKYRCCNDESMKTMCVGVAEEVCRS